MKLVFCLLFVLLSLAKAAPDACFTEDLKDSLFENFVRIAKDGGYGKKSIRCLAEYVNKFESGLHSSSRANQPCLDRQLFMSHMREAIHPCFHDIDDQPIAADTVVNKETLWTRRRSSGVSETSPSSVNVPPIRQGLSETVRKKKRKKPTQYGYGTKEPPTGITEYSGCRCTDGCHYCCVNSGLPNRDWCGYLYCGGGLNCY